MLTGPWRRAAVLAVAVSLVLPVAGRAAGPGDTCGAHTFRAWLLHRTSPEPRPLSLSGTFRDPRSALAMVIAAAVRHSRRGWDLVGDADAGLVVVGGNATVWPDAYSNGRMVAPGSTPGPPVAALCHDGLDEPPPGPIDLWAFKNSPLDYDFYMGVYDVDVTFHASSGWAVTPVSGGSMTVIGEGDSGTGVAVQTLAAERFDGTPPVPGGRWGSAVWADLPCADYLANPTSVVYSDGVGAATLYGGDPQRAVWPDHRNLRCSGINATIAGSPGPTTWRLVGEAIGVNAARVRLGVFNFPPPPRL